MFQSPIAAKNIEHLTMLNGLDVAVGARGQRGSRYGRIQQLVKGNLQAFVYV
jgi:hypothetical protein